MNLSNPNQGGQPEPAGSAAGMPSPSWDDLHLVHASLPEIDLDEVDCSLVFLGQRLRLPLLIDAAAAGDAAVGSLARAGALCGAGLIVALDRAAVAREAAPAALLVATTAASQLLDRREEPAATVARAAAAGAGALAVQLDFLRSAMEPLGQVRTEGLAAAIAAFARALPVIVRSGESGLTLAAAQRLKTCGAAALDAGGRAGDGGAFRDWGVPAAASVANAAATGLPVIASTGIRHGLDAAKAIATGASLVAMGQLLLTANGGDGDVLGELEQFATELRAAMFLTGSRTLDDLRRARPVILGATLEWLKHQDTSTQFR